MKGNTHYKVISTPTPVEAILRRGQLYVARMGTLLVLSMTIVVTSYMITGREFLRKRSHVLPV